MVDYKQILDVLSTTKGWTGMTYIAPADEKLLKVVRLEMTLTQKTLG